MKELLLAMLTTGLFAIGCGASHAEEPDWATIHDGYDMILKAAVKDGVVDYKAVKDREARLDTYLSILADADPSSRPRAERLAFWINAYNAFTLKLILKKYPEIKSINEFGKPWDMKEWKAAGKLWTLNEIEHQVLRKDFKEPRIHFAIVCASFSCPDLSRDAYVAAKLSDQLEAAAEKFLQDEKKGFRVVSKDGGRVNVEVSKLFEWFAKDFVDYSGSVLKYILPYVPAEDSMLLKSRRRDVRISFMDYDWSLNGK